MFDKVAAEASVIVVEDALDPACGLAGSWAVGSGIGSLLGIMQV
ncbi:MAG: hypothetical protein NTV12_02820 [Verrucomicrobia bacterium]|nr:hypothetical protein [Verrucomicrobiota bacterium]